MAGKALATKDVPWCLLGLVILATACHVCVLVGNHHTAASIATLGRSTKGWSGVGLDISHSLQHELDAVMVNMSDNLVQAINHTMHTSQTLMTVTSLAGMAADHMVGSDAAKAISLLQEHAEASGAPLGLLPDLLTSSANKMVDKLLKKAIEALDMLLEKIKPVLLEVGKFILKFGDQVQTVIEGFSITLDGVQKLFDQVMSSVSKHGEGEEQLRHETFNLFDVSNTGYVNKQDLKDVATLYDVSAFRGEKADELVDKYDQDKDGRLNKAEFKTFVHDPSLPNSMPVLLRTYAKRLAEVAGNVAAAKQRDEVAQRVVHYLQLVCAKNKTKLEWVAGHLSDGSLPLAFTADVMGELALAMGSPDVLTKADVGALVVGKMIELNLDHTSKAVKLMSNASFWIKEGFHAEEHPICMHRVANWVSKALTGKAVKHGASFTEIGAEADTAFQTGEQNMKAHLESLETLRAHAYKQMFQTQSSRIMLGHLLGGSLAAHEPSSEAARIVKAGMPARPETLLFAKELANNATATAKHFQKLCFTYTSKSSNNMDAFATQIQGMVKKIQGFIKMMMKYSTPAGIKQLETQVHDFAEKAGKDVLKVVKKKFGTAVRKSAPVINGALDSALDTVGNKIAASIATPLGQALTPALEMILQQSLGSQSNKTSHKLGKQLAELLGENLVQLSGDALGHKLAQLLHQMINDGVSAASKLLNNSVSLGQIPGLDQHLSEEVPFDHVLAALNEQASRHLATSQSTDNALDLSSLEASEVFNNAAANELAHTAVLQSQADEDSESMSGVWNEVAMVLRSLSNVLPQATKTLKFARLEVSKLAANLDGLFKPFEETGPNIFDNVAGMWDMIWNIYFFIMVPLTLGLLAYGFWAGGYFGGPGNLHAEEEDQTPEEEKGIAWRLRMCCKACCAWCSGCHDWTMSFWSILIFLQLFVVLIFLVALIFCILAGVKAFIAAGCSQIYILGDEMICGQALQGLRSFLESFQAGWLADAMPQKCLKDELLVCRSIRTDLKTSSILTVIFSFLAAVFSLQMIVESATLHTRAVCRRQAVKEANAEK